MFTFLCDKSHYGPIPGPTSGPVPNWKVRCHRLLPWSSTGLRYLDSYLVDVSVLPVSLFSGRYMGTSRPPVTPQQGPWIGSSDRVRPLSHQTSIETTIRNTGTRPSIQGDSESKKWLLVMISRTGSQSSDPPLGLLSHINPRETAVYYVTGGSWGVLSRRMYHCTTRLLLSLFDLS